MGNQCASGLADVTVASVFSLKNERLLKYNPLNFKLLIFDEVHHMASPSYLRILEHFGAESEKSKVNVIGLTATLFRADGKGLACGLDEIVYHRHFVDMIKDNWLVEPKVINIKWSTDLVLADSSSFLDQEKLKKEAQSEKAIFEIPRAWLEHASNRSSTLVFCINVEHSLKVCNAFRKLGIDARALFGETNDSERETLIQDFRKKKFPVLVNCMVLTEGTDIPNIDCLMIARPTSSPNLLTQMIGRGLRLHEGKRDCLILDFCDSLRRVSLHVDPTLAGLSPDEVENFYNKSKNSLANPDYDPKIYGLQSVLWYSKLRKLIEMMDNIKNKDRSIFNLSTNAWVAVGMGRYVLSFLQKVLIIDTNFEDGTHKISEYTKEKLGTRVYNRKRIVSDRIPSLKFAIRAAETYISNLKTPRSLISRKAVWRMRPASVRQINFLKKSNLKLDEKLLTAGVAADMITKVIYGGKGRQVRTDKLQSYLKHDANLKRITTLKELKG